MGFYLRQKSYLIEFLPCCALDPKFSIRSLSCGRNRPSYRLVILLQASCPSSVSWGGVGRRSIPIGADDEVVLRN